MNPYLASPKQTLDAFVDLFQSFLLKKISVDDFSRESHRLWQLAEKQTGKQNDILWSELADILTDASELAWYSRSAVENYPLFFKEIQSFIGAHKKIGKNQRKTTT